MSPGEEAAHKLAPDTTVNTVSHDNTQLASIFLHGVESCVSMYMLEFSDFRN